METINFFRLGQMLANKRRARKWQGEEVARAVGIHPVTLSRIEHGKLPGVTVAVLTRLAFYLDISLDQLVGYYPGKALIESIAQAQQAAQVPLPPP